MTRKTLKCHDCKESFPAETMVKYATARSNTMYNYCPKCLEEKKAREAFSDKVCMIFGLKAPGPRIWGDRKRLINTYGYTDATIIDCLDYIYKVEKKRKLSESLALVKPDTVDRMLQYKQRQENKVKQIVAAIQTPERELVVPIAESKEKEKENWDMDSWLDD